MVRRSTGRAKGLFDGVRGFVGRLVLPDPYYTPTQVAECCSSFRVSFLRARKFPGPPLRVHAWDDPVVGARMPEASVNEDTDHPPCEQEVNSPSGQSFNPRIHPKTAASPMKFLPQH